MKKGSKVFIEKNGDGKYVGTGRWQVIDEHRIASIMSFKTRKAAREFIARHGLVEIPPSPRLMR